MESVLEVNHAIKPNVAELCFVKCSIKNVIMMISMFFPWPNEALPVFWKATSIKPCQKIFQIEVDLC